jgi:hypothetical protein
MNYTIIKDSKDINSLERKFQTNNFNEYSVDLEGESLCRDGKILNIQIFVIETNEIIIFDCMKLSIIDIKQVLAPIFENCMIVKYMFDCRSDVDALYHQYNIKMQGIVDVQLFEIGFRKCNGCPQTKHYQGLFKTLNDYATKIGITTKELDIKKKQSQQFDQKNYDLNINDANTLSYLSIDVIYLKKLYLIFRQKVGNGRVRDKIEIETENRQNIWTQPVFIKDRSRILSTI